MYVKLPNLKLISISFLSVLIAIVFVEFFLRVSNIFIVPPHLTQKSEKFGFEHIPDARGINKSNEFDIKVFINSEGLRDYEIPKEKPPNTKRIALVGDSFIEGIQVELEKTVAKQLESNLGKESFQVINFGVGGYGMDQKFLYIKEKVVVFNPDTIILFLSSNDLDDIKNNNLLTKENGILNFRTVKIESSKVKKIKDVLRKSYLANFLWLFSLKKDQTISKSIPMEFRLYQGLIDQETQTYLEMTKDLIVEAKKLTEGNNAEFILITGADRIQAHPKFTNEFVENYLTTSDKIDYFNKYFNNFAKENNIIYLDLLPIFRREIENNHDVYFNSDGHWNEYGHGVVARNIANFLREK